MIDTVLGGRYRITTLIARGGMADVYAAHDDTLDRPVAVKVLRPDEHGDPDQFLGELLAQARVTHEAVVRLYDAGSHNGLTYLVMEHVAGRSLRERIADEVVPPAQCARIGVRLAEALDRAHELGVVHQDIKPANVLLDDDGNVRLADFGIAHLTEMSRSTAPGTTFGTAAYLAPEQVAGGNVGPPADIYALGLVLLEALTGRREYAGPTIEAALARLSRDPDVPDDLPSPWPRLLRAMTDRDPARRPAAGRVAAHLQAAAGTDHAPTAALERPSTTTPGTARRWPVVAAATAALVVAALLATAPDEPVQIPEPAGMVEEPPDREPPAVPAAGEPQPAAVAQPPSTAPGGRASGPKRGQAKGPKSGKGKGR